MKLVLRIFNLVYIVLAAVACVALFTKPIVAINANVGLPKEQVTELIYPNLEGQIEKADWDSAMGALEKDNLEFTLNLEVPAASILTKDAKQITVSLTNQVNTAVDDVVKELDPVIKKLAEIIAKKAANTAIKDSIKDQIINTNPGSDAAQIMADCGITDEYVSNMTDEIYDKLLGTDDTPAVKTVDELSATVDEKVNEICHMLANGGVEGYPKDEAELQAKIDTMSGDINDQLEDALKEAHLCDEDGNINDLNTAIDEFLANMLDQILGGDSSTNEGTSQSDDIPSKLVYRAEGGSQEQEETKLQAKIREIINQKIEEFNINSIVEQYWFVPLVLTLGLMLPWLIFIIITIIRTIRKKKIWTKSWVVFVFAFLQVVFGILLYIITAKFIGQLLEIIPVPDNPAFDILKTSTFNIQTSSFIPSILYLVMIPLTIAYMILAHKTKVEYKTEKKDRKSKKKSEEQEA